MTGIYLSQTQGNIHMPQEVITMRDWIESIQARSGAQARYDRTHTTGFYMKLNLRTDLDIIRWLWKQPSKQGSIKKLIREAISRESEGHEDN